MSSTSTSSSPVRTRLAPSPTGYPHIGTAFQALFDYVIARKHNGQFIIRIEDTDRNRLVPDAEKVIFEALDWLGLIPDESPRDGGPYAPYRQSERLDIYKKHAIQLIESGHAYYCFCSPERLAQVRAEQQKQGKPPMYDQHCRLLDPALAAARALKEPHVIRLKVPSAEKIVLHDAIRGDIEFDSSVVDDQVLIKSDGYPTYHLAVVVDDHLMKITHIIRGEEWISSTPKHLLLYRFFNWPVPVFIHTPLLRNPDRSKLSKRHGHASVFWYRDQGYLVEAVLNFLATRVWNHPQGKEVFGIDDLIKYFSVDHMHIQGPIADLDKLNWLNGQWIRRLDDKVLFDRLQPFLPKALDQKQLKALWPHVKDRLTKLSDIETFTTYLFQDPDVPVKLLLKESKLSASETAAYLESVHQTLSSLKTWDVPTIESALHDFQATCGLKPRPAFMSIRLAVTGLPATPPLFDVLTVLGQETVLTRLQTASRVLESTDK